MSSTPSRTDHPLLSALAPLMDALGCSIVEAANREAADVTVLCKPATKPLGSGSSQTQQGPQRQGGLGGFLKGITGNTGEGR